MKVGDRIRAKRQDLGMSVDELAARLGKNRATMYRYEKGDIENMPVNVLEPLAEVLQTTPAYLMGWTPDDYDWERDLDHRLDSVYGPRWDAVLKNCGGDYSKAWQAWKDIDREQAEEARKMWRVDQEATLKNKNAPVAKSHESVDWKRRVGAIPCNAAQVAPLLGTVRAGLPMYAEENIEGYIPIRQTDGAKYFWLNIRGDSMNAAGMNDGDQILVREQPEVENGEIAVVLVNGDEATVKTFRQEGNLVILTPRSSNPVHQPQVYDLKKTPVQVLGRVIECRKVY